MLTSHPIVSIKALFKTSILSGCVILSACSYTTPNDVSSLIKDPTTYETVQSFSATSEAEWPSKRWWNIYSDTQLSELIAEAFDNSPDLRIATARIKQASAYAKQVGADLLPSLNLSGSATQTKQSYNLGYPVPEGWNDSGNASFDLNWNLDFWGRTRAQVAAATSELKAQEIEATETKLILSTSIAAAYADLSSLYAEKDAAEEAVKVRKDTAKLMSERNKQGLENEGAALSAKSAYNLAQAELTAVNENIQLTNNRIAALLGEGPDRGLQINRPKVKLDLAYALPANIPAELISRRPDIIAAKLRAEAAASNVKVAKTNFFPNINLSAFIGLQSLTLNEFTKKGSDYGSIGPVINLPIFEGGRLKAILKGAKAEYEMAIAQYDATLVNSLNQVADIATSKKYLSGRLNETKLAENDAKRAWQVNQKRYKGGLASYLEVLTAEDAYIKTHKALTGLETRTFALDIALIKALGGGFRLEQEDKK